eukprot:m.779104 g.779104  ORF g.779104 m.779104 type:complete len:290 (+) comp23277_c0_seq7:824-1693(+)
MDCSLHTLRPLQRHQKLLTWKRLHFLPGHVRSTVFEAPRNASLRSLRHTVSVEGSMAYLVSHHAYFIPCGTCIQQANSKSKVRAETLENLLQEESELLGSIFGGKYGSPLEQRLEEQERALSTQLSSVQHTKSNWLQAHDWLGKGAHSTLAMAQESCQQAVHEATQGATRSNTQIMFESGTLARLRDTLQQSYTTLARTWYFLPDVRLPYLGGEHMNVLYALGREVFARAMQPDGLVHMLRYIEDIRSRTAGAQGWVGDVINKRIMGDYAATGAPRKFVLGALRVPLPQ